MGANEIQLRLAENLKRMRKEHGMTQFELAEKASISEAMLKCVELASSWPSEKTLMQLSYALNVDVYHFFMPVPTSTEQQYLVNEKIRKAIAKNIQDYVNEVLKNITENQAPK